MGDSFDGKSFFYGQKIRFFHEKADVSVPCVFLMELSVSGKLFERCHEVVAVVRMDLDNERLGEV